MVPRVTLLELVIAVGEYAESEAEVVATVTSMVNRGTVRLCGNFAGAHIDLGDVPAEARVHAGGCAR
jgi:hypothetical protein